MNDKGMVLSMVLKSKVTETSVVNFFNVSSKPLHKVTENKTLLQRGQLKVRPRCNGVTFRWLLLMCGGIFTTKVVISVEAVGFSSLSDRFDFNHSIDCSISKINDTH